MSDSHWNVGAGARNMLMYLESRGLRVGLLPRILMDNKKLIDGTIKIFEERMDFSFSRNNIRFDNKFTPPTFHAHKTNS